MHVNSEALSESAKDEFVECRHLLQQLVAGQHIDVVVETNGQGNGTVHISEPGVSNRAQVIIDTGHLFATPTYRATDIFTW